VRALPARTGVVQRMAKVTKLYLTFDAKPAGAPRKFTGIAYADGSIPDYGFLGDDDHRARFDLREAG
jgi:hypothetical protein